MHIFISHSSQDRDVVERIVLRLKSAGHTVWFDRIELRAGDNLQLKIEEGLKAADALLVVVSTNSFRSQWVQHEFSAMAFADLSKGKRRIIPVKIDNSEVPSYLADRLYVDLSKNFESGLDRLVKDLSHFDSSVEASMPPSVGVPDKRHYAEKLRGTLQSGRLTLVCGAGVSVAAGVPVWGELLFRLLGRMMERLCKSHSMPIDPKAAAKFQRRHGSSSLILGKYLQTS